MVEGVYWAAPRDPRNWSGCTFGGHLYWGKTYDLPLRWVPVAARWSSRVWFAELNFGRFHVGVCR